MMGRLSLGLMAMFAILVAAACATPIEPEGKVEGKYDNVVMVKFHADG